MSNEAFKVPVMRCARCAGDHEQPIQFREFGMHRPDAGFTHWGWCPVSQEPILLTVVEGEHFKTLVDDNKNISTSIFKGA